MATYFGVLLWIGFDVMRSEKKGSESESFLAADRDMNLFQSTASTAATDLGGGFSIAMGGLGSRGCFVVRLRGRADHCRR